MAWSRNSWGCPQSSAHSSQELLWGGVRLRHGKDFHQGSEYLQIIFGSVFFVSLGILADVKALQVHVLLFLLVLVVVAIISKVLGCGGAALLTRSRLKDSMIIGIGMAPRGEVAMIIALIGLDGGLIGQDVYVSIILMSLLTTIASPIALRKLLPEKRVRDSEGRLAEDVAPGA